MPASGKRVQKLEVALDEARARAIGRKLLTWYARNQRDLPWRRTRDPYAIWVSEMMLQQTQVSTVIPYYQRWMQRFPDLQSLARADEHAVLHSWQGLGYYSRAKNLQRAARALSERGSAIPAEVEALRALPGIGPYSAGAIASIAFGKQEPVVDGNVIRVLARLFVLAGDPTEAKLKAQFWDVARALVPRERPGDFNQALMELGATVCTPREPRCASCPLRAECGAEQTGRIDELPTPKARAVTTAVAAVAAIVKRGGRVLVVRLPESAPRWGGMWQFPNSELRPGETAQAAVKRALGLPRASADVGEPLCRIRHSVTRYRIALDAYAVKLAASAKPRPPASWHSIRALGELAMPSAHRK
ncbi:MAG TPA: A/G-specific adenine glycosylase, partial [Polyangiaceae bacterium]